MALTNFRISLLVHIDVHVVYLLGKSSFSRMRWQKTGSNIDYKWHIFDRIYTK